MISAYWYFANMQFSTNFPYFSGIYFSEIILFYFLFIFCYAGRYSIESESNALFNQKFAEANSKDRREKFLAVKSMSMESQGSSGSLGSNTHMGVGGSYSSKTGASSKLIGAAGKY